MDRRGSDEAGEREGEDTNGGPARAGPPPGTSARWSHPGKMSPRRSRRESPRGTCGLVRLTGADRFFRVASNPSPDPSADMPDPIATPEAVGERALLRHTLATLAYRGAKTLRDAPEGFGHYRVGEGSRTPLQILAHIGDLLDWALTQARGEERWTDSAPGAWDSEVDRFFGGLAALEAYLVSDAPLGQSAGRIFQGAVADALAHVGQLAMLRRLAGAPVRGENYNRADVRAGRLGPEQPAPRREFD